MAAKSTPPASWSLSSEDMARTQGWGESLVLLQLLLSMPLCSAVVGSSATVGQAKRTEMKEDERKARAGNELHRDSASEVSA